MTKASWIANLRDVIPGASGLSEILFGFSAKRSLPRWTAKTFIAQALSSEVGQGAAPYEVVLFTDTFNNYFEPENLTAARRVLESAGYVVHIAKVKNESRPLCCGRTFLATGMLDEAKIEARRTIDTLMPYVVRGIAIVGLEPSCLLTLRDEFIALFPGDETEKLASNAFLFEEFLVREKNAGRLNLNLKSLATKHALLHGRRRID